MTDAAAPFVQYDFGSNWKTFVDGYITEERIELAKQSLVDFMGVDDLSGRSFVDLGCGSGLFSLAAHLLGAERVLSIDINPNSVACCNELRERSPRPEAWEVRQGSILEPEFVSSLGQHDVVYSWGVLHHTGSMWEAIANAATCVAPGGLFYIALYNTAEGIGMYSDGRIGSSRFWVWEKKLYVSMPRPLQWCVDMAAAGGMVLGYLLTLQNPVRKIREHKSLRGMAWMVDIRDWLGGYPYEHVKVDEVFHFNREKLGFELINLYSSTSLTNNEFLFRRPA